MKKHVKLEATFQGAPIVNGATLIKAGEEAVILFIDVVSPNCRIQHSARYQYNVVGMPGVILKASENTTDLHTGYHRNKPTEIEFLDYVGWFVGAAVQYKYGLVVYLIKRDEEAVNFRAIYNNQDLGPIKKAYLLTYEDETLKQRHYGSLKLLKQKYIIAAVEKGIILETVEATNGNTASLFNSVSNDKESVEYTVAQQAVIIMGDQWVKSVIDDADDEDWRGTITNYSKK